MVKYGLFLLAVITAFLVLSNTPIPGYSGLPVFVCESPVFILIAALLTFSLIITFLKRPHRRFSWVMALHVALILFAVGAAIRMTQRVESIPFKLYYNISGYRIGKLRLPNLNQEQNMRDLGFSVGCDSFVVGYYPGEPRQEKSYTAQLFLMNEGVDSHLTHQVLSTNAPVTHNGWSFYLQTYDPQQEFIVVFAVKDPAVPYMVVACYLAILSSFGACAFRVMKLLKEDREVTA